VQDARDECILVYQRTHGIAVRHVSLTNDDNLWVGGQGNQFFDLLEGTSGRIIVGFHVQRGGYGGLVDGEGVLWSVDRNHEADGLLRYDTNGTLGTNDDSCSFIGHSDVYVLGIDSAGAL